jgi:hypothetical protein
MALKDQIKALVLAGDRPGSRISRQVQVLMVDLYEKLKRVLKTEAQ